MDAAHMLRHARRAAGLSQRDLAGLADVAQPAIARIESGAVTPRMDTLAHLLDACGASLEVETRPGAGIDRTVIRELLRLTPAQRFRLAVDEANNLGRLLEAAR